MTKDAAPTSPKDAALTLALEALQAYGSHAPNCDHLVLLTSLPPQRKPCSCGLVAAITDIKEALAESERTGWPAGLLQDDDRKLSKWLASRPDAKHVVDMAQPERTWVGLTREEINSALSKYASWYDFAAHLENILKEKNK